MQLLLLAFLTVCAEAQNSPVIRTSTGPIQGRLLPSLQVYEFIGIPYAEAPVGRLRFKKTTSKKPWTRTLIATKMPKVCPQISPIVMGNLSMSTLDDQAIQQLSARMDEDCLYLNLWVPKETLDSRRKKTAPYTYIHGGSFNQGGAMIYNGSVFASENDVVYGIIQYRLGVLGFAYDGTTQAPGNMGLWDQVEAFRWLCSNFPKFGADCSKHTIGGTSAGAIAVSLHLLSPVSRRYFKRAIMESGSVLTPTAVSSSFTAESVMKKLTSSVGNGTCKRTRRKFACLRKVDAVQFPITDRMTTNSDGQFFPVVDGRFLPKTPIELLESGKFAKYPTLLGANKDEGTVFMTLVPEFAKMLSDFGDGEIVKRILTVQHYDDIVKAAFNIILPYANPLVFDAIKYHYWPTDVKGYPYGEKVFDAISQALGDAMATCPTYKWADYVAESLGDKLWVYHYTHMPEEHYFAKWMGVTHGSEIPIILGSPLLPITETPTGSWMDNYGYSVNDRVFSVQMMEYWANFIKNGDPNILDKYGATSDDADLPWPSYSNEDCKAHIVNMSYYSQIEGLGAGFTCSLKAKDCSFWYDYFPVLEAFLSI